MADDRNYLAMGLPVSDPNNLLDAVNTMNSLALGPMYAGRDPGIGAGAGPVPPPQPYSVVGFYSRANGPNEHTWHIIDPSGQKVGGIDTTWNPNTGNLNIDNISGPKGQPNTLGFTAIRQLRDALLARFPAAQTLTGLRTTGATYADRPFSVGPGREAVQNVKPTQGGDDQ